MILPTAVQSARHVDSAIARHDLDVGNRAIVTSRAWTWICTVEVAARLRIQARRYLYIDSNLSIRPARLAVLGVLTQQNTSGSTSAQFRSVSHRHCSPSTQSCSVLLQDRSVLPTVKSVLPQAAHALLSLASWPISGPSPCLLGLARCLSGQICYRARLRDRLGGGPVLGQSSTSWTGRIPRFVKEIKFYWLSDNFPSVIMHLSHPAY